MNLPLWEFALARYAQPEVQRVCLAAQDRCGADVNLLLYLAWITQQGQAREQAEWRDLSQHVLDYRRGVTAVRRLRRRLARESSPGRAGLLEQARATELSLEQLQLALIEDWHRLRPPATADAGNLPRQLLWLVPALAAAPALLDQLVQHLEPAG